MLMEMFPNQTLEVEELLKEGREIDEIIEICLDRGGSKLSFLLILTTVPILNRACLWNKVL